MVVNLLFLQITGTPKRVFIFEFLREKEWRHTWLGRSTKTFSVGPVDLRMGIVMDCYCSFKMWTSIQSDFNIWTNTKVSKVQ